MEFISVLWVKVSTLTLSARASSLQPSPTLAMTARARKMMADGIDVISFAAGEPDFNTPAAVCEAAIKAINEGQTKYAPSRGIPGLQNAVVAKCLRENKLTVAPDQIVVSCGAKHSLYNALQVLIDQGDEVILFAPYWMTYADQVRLAGGTPVIVQTSSAKGFVPEPEAFAAAITPRTKAVVINTPSNPTGGAIDRATLEKLVEIAMSKGLWIISDEIYERLTYGHEHVSIATFGAEVAEKTVTVLGCSKTYSMTGWRIGFSVSSPKVASAMANLQDQVTSNATTFAQWGAVAALNLPDAEIEAMRSEFEVRRDLGLEILRSIDGVVAPTPKGAFYFFIDVAAKLGGSIQTDVQLAEHLLEHANIACIPGSVFEGKGCLRLSYATSRSDIEKGLGRLKTALEAL